MPDNLTRPTIFNAFIPLFRAKASLELENQIKRTDGLVSGFEKRLSADGPIPDVPSVIKARTEDIRVRKCYLF